MVIFNPTNWFRGRPAPPAFGKDKIVPQEDANPLSLLVFEWLAPFLSVGASRPLEKDDLWTLPRRRRTDALADLIEEHFYALVPPDQRPKNAISVSDSRNDGADIAGASESGADIEEVQCDKEKAEDRTRSRGGLPVKAIIDIDTTGDTKKQAYPKRPLLSAIHRAFFWRWWAAGCLKFAADTLKTCSPLVTKLLLAWLSDAFAYAKSDGQSAKPRGVGYGIGLGVALFAMQEASSLMTNHFTMAAMTNGLLTRSGVIGAIFRKSLRLSGKARQKHSVGQITTMISTDASRLDQASAFFHNLWVSPIQIAIGVALLINNLGYSALVGLGVLILGLPIQFLLVRLMFLARKSGVQITDRRVRLTSEVLSGIRLIKLYAWESFYAQQITDLRRKELVKIRKSALARATIISIMVVVPISAAVLSFITYALSGHDLNVAIIFSSLQYFNIIRMPLALFPLVFSNCADALVALNRIGTFLTAEELDEPYIIDDSPDSKYDVRVEASFTWESVGKVEAKFNMGGSKNKQVDGKSEKRRSKINTLPAPVTSGRAVSNPSSAPADDEKKQAEELPFALSDVKLQVPKGEFVAIVGRVGSGKSSLLQSLVGEMRKTKGEVVFGGSVAYVPQQAWIMNATLRENILFGQEDDETRFQEIVDACSLRHDIDVLPNGEDTEIGERGINLSGGQKARVSLARAAFSDSDIILLDDPLSAVDAHVGESIVKDCLLKGPLSSKTRVLVTHALHVLPRVDYIYLMDNGKIVEEGTYQSLLSDGQEFSRLIEEFGAAEREKGTQDDSAIEDGEVSKEEPEKKTPQILADKKKATLMQDEERNRGAVPGAVYTAFLKFAGGLSWAPTIILLMALYQGASVANNVFLGFWTDESISGFSQGDYMGVYAALGFSQAFFSFLGSFGLSLLGLAASLRIFGAALNGVLRSPVSFFDTTPMGRIMSRLSKDQDTLDTQLTSNGFMLLMTFSNVLGTVALVFYTFPYLGIIFAPLSVLYYVVAKYYRLSSVETKRLDSLMRSALYAAYSEALTGVATIRAYGGQRRFVLKAEEGLDMENRAYYMTIAIQRWLSVRLDLFGNILILGIAMFAAGFRTTVDPSKIGVVLSYSLSITQTFSDMVSQYATNEQNMNAVERIIVYTELSHEGKATRPIDIPKAWPDRGAIAFKDVDFAYREGLPRVLKKVNFEVKPGEKIGIVGRTGAGKSSLLQALFRMVEVQDGIIEVDGFSIQSVELERLRRSLALVPQDSTLFMGTLRENLDPQNTRTDAEILSALRRTWLLPPKGTPVDKSIEAKFSLDSTVSDEGSNYSAGEKQLLALCRALVKNSRVIVLDEATSSVDAETDAKVQRTIQREFKGCTLLCIAHRLKTIVYYDRVLVMDAGKVAEYASPLELYDQRNSIFRSLCDEASLTRQEIEKIREGAKIENHDS